MEVILMKYRIWVALATVVAIIVLQSAIRIEILNAQAENYLPRKVLDDGKWRMSPNNSPRDRLRVIVESYGLLQYLLAPFLFVISILMWPRHLPSFVRAIVIIYAIIAVCAMLLMFYRGYFSSLGW